MRFFPSIGVALKSPAQPSGSAPGWSRGGAALMLFVAGRQQGLDCFSAILVRVFCVKVHDLDVIYFFLLYPFVFVHPPLE